MELRTLLRFETGLASKRMAHVDNLFGFARAITYTAIAVRGRTVQPVGDWAAPINTSINTRIDAF